MKNSKITFLIQTAKYYMSYSFDPIHDIRHVKRVVKYAQELGEKYKLNEKQKTALELASWWHDMSRAVIKKPSFVWMLFVDDILSATMLWFFVIKNMIFSKTAGTAINLILCKNFGTGTILTKILLRKKNRILLDILKDADNLDLIHIERFETIRYLSEMSKTNKYAFKFIVWANLHTNILNMNTQIARMYIEKIITELFEWIQQQEVYLWHIKNFGAEWTVKTLEHFEEILAKIRQNNIQYTYNM